MYLCVCMCVRPLRICMVCAHRCAWAFPSACGCRLVCVHMHACRRVNVCAYTYIYIYIYIRIYIERCADACMHACMRTKVVVYEYVCIYANRALSYTYSHTHARILAYTYAPYLFTGWSAGMQVRTCKCIHTYLHTHTHLTMRAHARTRTHIESA